MIPSSSIHCRSSCCSTGKAGSHARLGILQLKSCRLVNAVSLLVLPPTLGMLLLLLPPELGMLLLLLLLLL
jgi:hypothetical protein